VQHQQQPEQLDSTLLDSTSEDAAGAVGGGAGELWNPDAKSLDVVSYDLSVLNFYCVT